MPLLLLWLATLLASGELDAEEKTARELLNGLQPPTAGVVDFVEHRMNPLLAEPQESRGTLWISGDRLEKRVTSPFTEKLVATPNEVILERNGKRRRASLRKRPEVRATFAAIRDLINGDASELLETFSATTEIESDRWRITLTPKSERLERRLKAMVVTGQHDMVQSVRTIRGASEWQELTLETQ